MEEIAGHRPKFALSIFTVAAALIFVGATITGMFAAGGLAKMGFERALGVDNCYYTKTVLTPVPVDGIKATEVEASYEENCRRDTANNTRREVADDLAMLIVALPLAFFFYRKMRKG